MAIGVPGWPEFAAWTASIASVRMVLTLSVSSWAGGCKAVVASMAGSPARQVLGASPLGLNGAGSKLFSIRAHSSSVRVTVIYPDWLLVNQRDGNSRG